MFGDPDDDPGFRWFFAVMPVALAVVLLLVGMNSPPSSPAPSNRLVFGCYAADEAPAIRLDASGMHIEEPGFPTIPFHIERQKTGYALVADRPIQAKPTAHGFGFSFYSPGEGTFLEFFHIVDGKKYGVFDDAELASFDMLARDGAYISYVRAPQSSCSSQASYDR